MKVSLTESVAFSESKAELAVKDQAPSASMEKSPYWPVVEEAVKELSVLSTSELVRVPEVVKNVGFREGDGGGGDGGGIVGAVDGDLNGAGGAINGGDVEGFADRVSGIQRVEG